MAIHLGGAAVQVNWLRVVLVTLALAGVGGTIVWWTTRSPLSAPPPSIDEAALRKSLVASPPPR